MPHTKLPMIEIGYQVFASDGGEEFGAVRYVAPDGRPELVVYIENAADVTIPLFAVSAVHSEKVIVDVGKLPDNVREAIKHSHERESV